MNRITAYADLKVQPKLDAATAEQKKLVDDTFAVGFDEHVVFQRTQTHAFAGGLISFEEAQTVYGALGAAYSESNGGWRPHVSTALKLTITKFVAEIATALAKRAA